MKNSTHPREDRSFDWNVMQATQCAMIYLFSSPIWRLGEFKSGIRAANISWLKTFYFFLLCSSPAPKQDEPYFLAPGPRKMMFDIVKGKKNSFPEGVWGRGGERFTRLHRPLTDCKCCRSSKGCSKADGWKRHWKKMALLSWEDASYQPHLVHLFIVVVVVLIV